MGASGVLWETHLRRTGQTPGSDSPARSSGQGGRAGSHPGSGSVGLGCSSPEGRGTGWRAWCLRSKVHRRSQPAGARPGPGPSGRTASSPSLPRPSGSAPGQTPGLRHRSAALTSPLTNPLTNPLTSRSHRPSQPVWLWACGPQSHRTRLLVVTFPERHGAPDLLHLGQVILNLYFLASVDTLWNRK